ncbi:ribonuclease H-like domain-containing protein [Tanacetum coccineum]|uniref:Ribonuclease H-like domain-containing protein n=1 Tax=Tanacetum coccineum TaxID=301880 RepID=A0ABQ5GVD8_9ASTR
MEAGTTSTTLTAKLPILNPGDYDLWLMRIEQYFLMTDYSLWEVIKNGNKVLKRTVGETEQEYEPTTAEEKQDRRNEMKARGTLLMALPNKDQLKFHSYKDAKLLMEAIEKRYGGNKESKKVQRTLLKQQYENFAGSSSETMDQTFDRLQKLITQLEIQGEVITQEDMNLKLLRSLPSEWKTQALIWRNKQEIGTISLDDLYNNLKIYKPKISRSSNNTAYGVNAAHTQSNPTSGDNLKQIDPDDLEETDLQWEMAMLTIRTRRFIKRTGRQLDVNGQRVGFDKGKENSKRTVTVETPTENALVAQDKIGGQIVDKFKTGLGYNAASSTAASPAVESFVNTSEMLENQEHNKSKSDKGYHKVPPPFTGNFIPHKPDLTFMDEIVESENLDVTTVVTPSNVKTVEFNHESAGVKSNGDAVEPKTVRKNSFRPPIIEDWNFDDEGEGNPQHKEYNKKGVIDSGCSRHMTGNKCYLTEYEDYDGGFVSFGDGKGRISGKGNIKTGTLDFDNVYFCKELKYNLFSVSQICDKKNNVLFTDTECLVLSSDFKLLDESQVLLRVSRKDNIYSVDLKSVVPTKETKNLEKQCKKQTIVANSTTKAEYVAAANYRGQVLWIQNQMLDYGFNFMNTKIYIDNESTICIMKNPVFHSKTQHIEIRHHFIRDSYEKKLIQVIKIHTDHNVADLLTKAFDVNGVAEKRNRTLIEAARTMVLVIKSHNKTPYELIHGRTPLIDFMKPFGCPVTILNIRDHLGKFNGKDDERFFVGYSVVSKAMRVFNKRTRIVEDTLNIRFLENAPNVIENGPDWLFDVDSLTISMNYMPVVAGNQTNGIAGTRDNIVAGQVKKKTEPEQEYILIPFCTTDPLISQGPKDSEEDSGMKPTEVDVNGASDKDGEDDQATRSEFERLLQKEKQTNSTKSFNNVGPPISAVGPSITNDDPSSPVNAAEASNTFEEHLFERFSPFKNVFTLPPISNMVPMDDTGIFGNAYDDEDVGAEADLNNLEITMNVSHIPTTRIDKDHPKTRSLETLIQLFKQGE